MQDFVLNTWYNFRLQFRIGLRLSVTKKSWKINQSATFGMDFELEPLCKDYNEFQLALLRVRGFEERMCYEMSIVVSVYKA